MNNEDSDLKKFDDTGAENANQHENQEQGIIELEGKGTRTQIKARNRATKPERNQLPGVNLQ